MSSSPPTYLPCTHIIRVRTQNKVFIFRGYEFEKLSDFNTRLAQQFPNAKVGNEEIHEGGIRTGALPQCFMQCDRSECYPIVLTVAVLPLPLPPLLLLLSLSSLALLLLSSIPLTPFPLTPFPLPPLPLPPLPLPPPLSLHTYSS